MEGGKWNKATGFIFRPPFFASSCVVLFARLGVYCRDLQVRMATLIGIGRVAKVRLRRIMFASPVPL